MSQFLPMTLVEEILLRLPVKSIVKFMLVCKSWNAMIKSHSFISSHLQLQRQHSLSNPLFFDPRWFGEQKQCSIFFPKNQSSFPVPNNKFTLFIGAINGVVCLTALCFLKSNIILWNPMIHRHIQLPKQLSIYYRHDIGFDGNTDDKGVPRPTLDSGSTYDSNLGFGFDSHNNDYKVVWLCYTPIGSMVPPIAELYSLNEGAWRVIDASSIKFGISRSKGSLFFHGNVHWLVWVRRRRIPAYRCILVFNVAEEKFKKMKLPRELAMVGHELDFLDITVIEDCLSLAEYVGSGCNIWMKKESWNKIYCVCLEVGMTRKVLGLSTSCEVLVVTRPHGDTVSLNTSSSLESPELSFHSFDLKSHEMRDLAIRKIRTESLVRGSEFTESLVLLDKESNATGSGSQDEDEFEDRYF